MFIEPRIALGVSVLCMDVHIHTRDSILACMDTSLDRQIIL